MTAGPYSDCTHTKQNGSGTAETDSPAAVKVHVSKKPEPKPRGAASHMGIDKAFDKRLRISELQKAQTVKQFMETPQMTYTDLGKWCKEKFKLEKAPSIQLYVNA